MLRLTRDVEQMERRCGRNPHIQLFKTVVNVRERNPDACVSIQGKRRGSPIAQQESSRASSWGKSHDMFDGGAAQEKSVRRLSPVQSANELKGML